MATAELLPPVLRQLANAWDLPNPRTTSYQFFSVPPPDTIHTAAGLHLPVCEGGGGEGEREGRGGGEMEDMKI